MVGAFRVTPYFMETASDIWSRNFVPGAGSTQMPIPPACLVIDSGTEVRISDAFLIRTLVGHIEDRLDPAAGRNSSGTMLRTRIRSGGPRRPFCTLDVPVARDIGGADGEDSDHSRRPLAQFCLRMGFHDVRCSHSHAAAGGGPSPIKPHSHGIVALPHPLRVHQRPECGSSGGLPR